MWTIGIKSSIITVLGLIAYGLLVQTMGGTHLLPENLVGGIGIGLGICSSHYHYKAARQGQMTYREGLQLGLLVSGGVGIVQGLLIYAYTKYIDLNFIDQLIATAEAALQQRHLDATVVEASVRLMQQYVTPAFLLVAHLSSTIVLGLAWALFIAAWMRTPSQAKEETLRH